MNGLLQLIGRFFHSSMEAKITVTSQSWRLWGADSHPGHGCSRSDLFEDCPCFRGGMSQCWRAAKQGPNEGTFPQRQRWGGLEAASPPAGRGPACWRPRPPAPSRSAQVWDSSPLSLPSTVPKRTARGFTGRPPSLTAKPNPSTYEWSGPSARQREQDVRVCFRNKTQLGLHSSFNGVGEEAQALGRFLGCRAWAERWMVKSYLTPHSPLPGHTDRS